MSIEADKNVVIPKADIGPIQLENPMKAYKKAYLILIPVGTIALAAMGGAIGALFGAVIGWTASYLFMQGVSGIKLLKLNFKEYSLTRPLTDNQLFTQLSSINQHPDFKVEKGAWGVYLTFKNTTTHRIRIDKEKQVYSIISKLTRKNLVKKRHNPGVTEYKHAYTAVPYIKQMIDAITTEARVEGI